MGKKKKHKKKRGGARQPQPLPTYRPSTPALDTAFFIPHIFENILCHVDMRTLLVSCQRVSRSWRDGIASSIELQQKLYFRPRTRQVVHRCICWGSLASLLNPSLLKYFSFMFECERTIWYIVTSEYELCEMCGFHGRPSISTTVYPRKLTSRLLKRRQGPANCGPGRRWHHAFMRKGASWRRMLIAQPAMTEVVYKTTWYTRECWNPPIRQDERVVRFPDGLRMGQLFDLMYSICFTQEPGHCYGVDFEWHAPSTLSTKGGVSSVLQNDGCRLVIEESCSIYLANMNLVPAFRNYRQPNYWQCRYRYERAREQTSNKWRFRSEDFVDGFVDFGSSLEERLAINEGVKRTVRR